MRNMGFNRRRSRRRRNSLKNSLGTLFCSESRKKKRKTKKTNGRGRKVGLKTKPDRPEREGVNIMANSCYVTGKASALNVEDLKKFLDIMENEYFIYFDYDEIEDYGEG